MAKTELDIVIIFTIIHLHIKGAEHECKECRAAG